MTGCGRGRAGVTLAGDLSAEIAAVNTRIDYPWCPGLTLRSSG